MAEIKPCPFCGGEIIRINAYGFGYYSVECLGCGVETARYKSVSKYLEGNLSFEEKARKAIEAIEAWNRRADNG